MIAPKPVPRPYGLDVPTELDREIIAILDLIGTASEQHHAGHHRFAVRLLHQAGVQLAGIPLPAATDNREPGK